MIPLHHKFGGPSPSRGLCWFLLLPVLLGGCSIRKLAVHKLGDALSAGGSTFGSDDDPDLVRAAVPFSLKLMESLLAETPRHEGLLLAAASGFTQYAYAFVQQDADEMEAEDLEAANALRARARRLYLRARDYGLRGLSVRHPGFDKELRAHPKQAVRALKPPDVPLAYWTAASLAAAVSVSKDQPEIIADLPLAEALMDRALELDEEFDHGAIHAFFITYELSRSGGEGDPVARATRHFERAMQLSHEKLAGPLVSYAEAVLVKKQDKARFQELLHRALAIQIDAAPESRLVNLVMQRRARWLLTRLDELFLQ